MGEEGEARVGGMDPTTQLVVVVLACAVVGAFIGLGVRAIALSGRSSPSAPLPRGEAGLLKQCLRCRETMQAAASICPHCRSETEAWTFHEGRWWVSRPDGVRYLDGQTWRMFNPPPPAT